MRLSLIPLTLMALPLAAHANTIDNFTLTGEGHTFTYSMPATTIVGDHPHFVSFGGNPPTTIDGVSGYTTSGTYFLPFLPNLTMTLSVPSTIDGGELVFSGPFLVSYFAIPTLNPDPTHPDDLVTTFLLGTFALTEANVRFDSHSAPYTLVISAQSATSATPEPASLTLLMTGLTALPFARRRIQRLAR